MNTIQEMSTVHLIIEVVVLVTVVIPAGLYVIYSVIKLMKYILFKGNSNIKIT